MEKVKADAERFKRIVEAKVPLPFIENALKKQLQEAVERIEDETLRKEAKEYLSSPEAKALPPDVRGKRWRYSAALDIIQEYWRKIKEFLSENKELRKELESLLLEDIEDIEFPSNYEVHLLLSLRSNPVTIRSTKMPLLATLLLLAIERGDIGKVKKENAQRVQHILEWYLERVPSPDTKELHNLLSKILDEVYSTAGSGHKG